MKINKNIQTWEEYRKTLTAEQYNDLVLEFYSKKIGQLTLDISNSEKQLKKMKQELKRAKESVETFEKFKEGGAEI